MGQRLIDANKLDLRFEYGVYEDGLLLVPFRDMRRSVDKAPTVDAVPVVRCRECIGQCTWVTGVNGTQICGMSGMFVVKDTDFCSYGERRDS